MAMTQELSLVTHATGYYNANPEPWAQTKNWERC